jgi:hypothetical protein
MRRCNRFFLGLLLALGLATSAATFSQGAGAARSELQFLAEPVVKNIYPLVYASSLRRLMAPSGAMDINRDYEAGKTQTWYIELQGLGTELISAGIAHERLDLVKDGLRALAWGLTQQRDDGGFDCPDAFHSTTTFLESTSRAVLLLSSSPLGSDPFVEKTLTDLRDGLAKTLRWVVEKDRLDHNIKAIQKSLPMRLFLISTSIG